MTGLIHFLCFHLNLQGKNLGASCSRAGLSKFRSPHRPVNLCYVSSFHFTYLNYSLLPTYQAHRKFSKYLNESVSQLKLFSPAKEVIQRMRLLLWSTHLQNTQLSGGGGGLGRRGMNYLREFLNPWENFHSVQLKKWLMVNEQKELLAQGRAALVTALSACLQASIHSSSPQWKKRCDKI